MCLLSIYCIYSYTSIKYYITYYSLILTLFSYFPFQSMSVKCHLVLNFRDASFNKHLRKRTATFPALNSTLCLIIMSAKI